MSSMAPGPAEPTGQAAPVEIPPTVAEAAAGRQFGPLIIGNKASSPLGNLAFGVAVAIGIAALSLLALWVASLTEVRAIAVLGCMGVVAAVIALAMAVMAGLRGSSATYLFANGFVHMHRSRLHVVPWTEVDELWLWKSGGKVPGKLLCYYVVTFDGRKIAIDLMSNTGDRTLGERLQEIVRHVGRPVRDSGPYVGRLRP